MTSKSNQNISSPASTGGAGTYFEQQVGTYWLAQLLVGSIPPIFTDATVVKVSFQTELLGWNTDDFLVECEISKGETKNLVGQVKRGLTISSSDKECIKTFEDFWQDFNNTGLFTRGKDRFVLVTLRGTNVLLGDFANLLERARASSDGAEFARRIATAGLLSNKAVQQCTEIQNIVAGIEGTSISPAEIWDFLRHVCVQSLDLHNATRGTEAAMKSLLAHTANNEPALDAATASWAELLEFASTAIPAARALTYSDLPQSVRDRHKFIGPDERGILRGLAEHSEPILEGIRTTLGLSTTSFHIERTLIVQEVINTLEKSQVVIISGSAGVGKSAIAKEVVSSLRNDHFTFGFRAEEFAQPHLDTALHQAQIPGNFASIRAVLAAQDKKIFLIESTERLLERATRDAFSDLLLMARSDPSMRLLLTCRDYSSEQVAESFLRPLAISPAVITVPHLDDSDLEFVEKKFPELSAPLNVPALRQILRNPYFLDQAIRISWKTEKTLPSSEREFRDLFWRQIVRRDGEGSIGIARERERTFQSIAVKRARALSPHVNGNDLDPNIIEALKLDSLISSPPGKPLMVATEHDATEDWAILRWIDENHQISDGSIESMSSLIGGHPAIRRSFRKWIAELVQVSPGEADKLFEAAIAESKISSQFRDDTLVSILKAPSAVDFLKRHESLFLANDQELFKRVIHLLRVACMNRPWWANRDVENGSNLNVPSGAAWLTVLEMVDGSFDEFSEQDHPLLLGLIEDAIRGVTWWEPELESAPYIASIGHALIDTFDRYSSEDMLSRVLKIIATIPSGDSEKFEALLRGNESKSSGPNWASVKLREIVYSGLNGVAAGRDFPDLVSSVGLNQLLATEKHVEGDMAYGRSMDLGLHFGVTGGLGHDYYPSSALRGPWLTLLHIHPNKAIDFYCKIMNHSVDWYVNPRVHDPLEPASEIHLTLADGSTRIQWANQRLWNMYRGTHVAPNVLESLLMSLENGLLDYAEKYPKSLDRVLQRILGQSESTTLTAVVASVATAYPNESIETLLVLLSSLDIFTLDFHRTGNEGQALSYLDMLPQLHAENEIYAAERKKSNSLPHRNQHLETVILNLQVGPHATRIQTSIDKHLSVLTAEKEPSDYENEQRIALHRMDLRQYTVADGSRSESETASKNNPAAREETKRTTVRLQPREMDSDIQAMVTESGSKLTEMNARAGMLNWAQKIFNNQVGDGIDTSQWKVQLEEAMSIDPKDEPMPEITGVLDGGPGIVAAVCVRDRWSEMDANQKNWCVNLIANEIERDSNNWDYIHRIQSHASSADRACARVAPLLMTYQVPKDLKPTIERSFVNAITHPINEVRWQAVWGVSESLWDFDDDLVVRSLNALATEMTLAYNETLSEHHKPIEQRRGSEEIIASAAHTVRKAFFNKTGIQPDAYQSLDLSSGDGVDVLAQALAIWLNKPDSADAVSSFTIATKKMAEWWNLDRTENANRGHRSYQSESVISSFVTEFVMRVSIDKAEQVLRPILDAMDSHPKEVSELLLGLIRTEDRKPNTTHFWSLWDLFASEISLARWVNRLDRDRPHGGEMVRAAFLNTTWKEDTRHWKSLEDHDDAVHDLFDALPASPTVLEEYVRFLYHVGEQSLPAAFVRVAKSLVNGDPHALLIRTNTVFMMEILLQRHVYRKTAVLKSTEKMREAVLILLDALVEEGSSAAFRMRDDFVTPEGSIISG